MNQVRAFFAKSGHFSLNFGKGQRRPPRFSPLVTRLFGISFLFLVEWNKEYFVLEIFKESLLALNQFATFLSSCFIVSKRFSILDSEINKFVSSANIIRVSLLELLKRPFIYMRSFMLQLFKSNKPWQNMLHDKTILSS